MNGKRRLLLDDEPINQEQDSDESGGSGSDLQQVQQSKIHSCAEYVVSESCGIRYQKCGGGRRVIRKSIGGA